MTLASSLIFKVHNRPSIPIDQGQSYNLSIILRRVQSNQLLYNQATSEHRPRQDQRNYFHLPISKHGYFGGTLSSSNFTSASRPQILRNSQLVPIYATVIRICSSSWRIKTRKPSIFSARRTRNHKMNKIRYHPSVRNSSSQQSQTYTLKPSHPPLKTSHNNAPTFAVTP